MKQSNFYFFRRTAIFLSVLVAMLLATVVTGSADEKAPTRKEPLDLSLYTETVDMLDSEGWKYEPAENGGVLTLHDFYLKGDHSLNYGAGLIYGGWNDHYCTGRDKCDRNDVQLFQTADAVKRVSSKRCFMDNQRI